MNFISEKFFKNFLLLLALTFFPFRALAIPQFTLLTGNKCLNCHVNNQGAGIRNELGWYSAQSTGIFSLEDVGLRSLSEQESNTYMDGLLTLGFDFRLQSVRSQANPDAERRVFPMQAALYTAVKATGWATIEASYNAGPISNKYPGQQAFTASALIQPSFEFPQLRVGFFQPSIGMRYDDHTMLVRQISGYEGRSLIAPNYAELGAELNYDALQWLTVSAGAFSSNSLAKNMVDTVSAISNKNNPSLLGRIVVWPRFFEKSVNTYLGASVLKNGDFSLVNAFGGVGLSDRLSFMAEYAVSDSRGLRMTNNVSAELMYQFFPPFLGYIRAEQGITQMAGKSREIFNQYIIGAQIFVLPFIELRPEYRIYNSALPEYSSRYAMQLHVFY